MRVLVVTKTIDPTIGGWGRYAKEIIVSLKSMGVESVVICNEKHDTSVVQLQLLPPSLSYKRVYIIPWVYVIKTFFSMKTIGKVDVIHCMAEPYAFYVYLLSLLFRKPYVVTLHGSRGVIPFQYKTYGLLQRVAYRNAKAIVCVSNYTKQRLLAHYSFSNVHVIANGVSKDTFPDSQSTVSKNRHAIMGVGGLKHRKGYHNVLPALGIVKKTVPDVHYTIVGDQNDHPYTNQLKSLITKHDLESSVTLLSGISDTKLNELYEQSGLFVLTSESEPYAFEGFGLVYLEANAHGTPVIGAFGSGAEEAIESGVSGFLVSVHDHKALAEKIKDVIEMDEAAYKRLSEGSYGWAQKHIWDNQVKKYKEVYSNVVRR